MAIFLTEVLKALISFVCLLTLTPSIVAGRSARFKNRLRPISDLFRADQILEMTIPALLYTLQNHLLYIGLGHLDTPIYLITSQLKILTTALCSVWVCQRVLHLRQWTALCLLTIGVIIVQFGPSERSQGLTGNLKHNDQLKGIAAVVLSSFLSGLAGCWFERSLKQRAKTSAGRQFDVKVDHQPSRIFKDDKKKDPDVSRDPSKAHSVAGYQPTRDLWTKNLQLSIPSLTISFAMVYLNPQSRHHVHRNGLMWGFIHLSPPQRLHHLDHQDRLAYRDLVLVWFIIFYHSLGGILVSVLVKQSNALTKNFATCLSIIFSTLVSSVFKARSGDHRLVLGYPFYLGCGMVFLSIRMFYS